MSLRPKLLCTVDFSIAPEALAVLEQCAEVVRIPADYEKVKAAIHEYDIYWGHVDLRLDRALLEGARRLRLIATASTGTNHIDLAAARAQGIEVVSLATEYALLETFSATAELAWMHVLAATRHFRQAIKEAPRSKWPAEHLMGRQLSDLTLGVIGVGRLGRKVCTYGRAFCRRVIACDPRPFQQEGVEQVDFATLIATADVISIHIHLTPENRGLFNADVFAAMKPGAVLVNTSRGDIIDEVALLAALESGRLAAFGADVLHDEWRPSMTASPVVQYAETHDNVTITPHIGGASDFSIREARVFIARRIAAMVREKSLPGMR